MAPDFKDPQLQACFITIADPQARFHRNRVAAEELTSMQSRRQVQQKLYP